MDNFVISNITHRRTRSFVTVFGVALGVVLVTLTIGLAHGQLAERGRREANAGAEILVRPGGTGLNSLSSSFQLDLRWEGEIAALDGVAEIVPVGNHLERSDSGFGWRTFDGVDFDRYAAMSGLTIVRGRAFAGPHEAIVDEVEARKKGSGLGDSVDFGGAKYEIVGVYAPESMSRVKIPLASMQEFYDASGFVSMMLVKVAPGADPVAVAGEIREKYPEAQILLTRDLPAFYAKGIPALTTFLNVVVGLSLVVSTLVIMLAMYTTVVERTRQIGILKSIGASRGFIALAIESEAVVISLFGVLLGYVIAIVAAFVLRRVTSLQIELELSVFLATGAVGLASGAIGALYPALRAANLDPVRALSYD